MSVEVIRLALADGMSFEGFAYGATGTITGEVVFTTGMTGYQEVLTDPSYCGQIVTMTAPQIGNTGINIEDDESVDGLPQVAGFIMRDPSLHTSNWRATASLDEYLRRNNIVAIGGIDTRRLTRHIRDKGAQNGCIGSEPTATLVDRARSAPSMVGLDSGGTCNSQGVIYVHRSPRPLGCAVRERSATFEYQPSHRTARRRYRFWRQAQHPALFGGHRLQGYGRSCDGFRATNLDLAPDGIFLSNGPGDPAAVTYAVATIRSLLGKKPIFGICLGHQLLGLALGGSTSKLKFGHRGLNQPVKDLKTGRIEITLQNHGFIVDVASLNGLAQTTHLHLNDGTSEGLEVPDARAFSVQYHPEAAAGPHDALYLFERFRRSMMS